MKTTALAPALFGALLVLGAAAPAMADGHIEKTEEKAPALTIDSSIEELMENEKTAAILQKYLPGIDQHPMYGAFKSMSLVQLQPMSGGAVTEETVAAVKAELEELA